MVFLFLLAVISPHNLFVGTDRLPILAGVP
jgi:hypothetical protein